MNHPCQDTEYAAILANAGPPIAADWVRERVGEWEADELLARPPFKCRDVNRFLQLIGSGRGSGRGIVIGRGIGIGSGRGSGRGIGSGSGIGIGRGIVIGIGIGELLTQRNVMRVGKAYLMHLGDWHTFVGRVKEQLGPLTYALEAASKVDIENLGDRWHDLAGGKDEAIRGQARYWHYAGEVVVPLSIAAIEWHGPTPQEAGLPGQ